MVTNIPRGLDVDYKEELRKIFEHYAVPDQKDVEEENKIKISITKICLVYDIEELIEKEEELKRIVEKKQEVLTENRLNFND